jgi:hypothetical protein
MEQDVRPGEPQEQKPMTRKQYKFFCVVLGACLVFTVEKYRLARDIKLYREQTEGWQKGINGNFVRFFGPKRLEYLLRDMTKASSTNAQLRRLLAEQGFTTNSNPAVEPMARLDHGGENP